MMLCERWSFTYPTGAQPGNSPRGVSPKPPLNIDAERIDHVFRLAESNVEHEAALRRVLEPERREVQGFELAGVQCVDDPSAVDTVARESVGMPCQYATHRARLDVIHHGIEDGSSWLPGRLRLDQFGDNPEALLLRELPELGKLGIDGQELMPVVVRRFPGVEEVLHCCCLLLIEPI